MQWQRLDRDNSVKVIDSVKSAENAGMFSIATSEVKRARLVFYTDYYLYKVTNFASLPSFSFQYLSDGTFFHYLDGTEISIYAVNDKGSIALNVANVLPYLDFFFSQVGDEDGDIMLINNPHDMPLLESLDVDVYQAVFSQHKPATVEYNENTGKYLVQADLYKDARLIRAKIEISSRGRVKIIHQEMIMHQMTTVNYTENAY